MATETFYQCAITCSVARETLVDQVHELFEEAGFTDSPEVYDPTGEYVLARIVGDDEHGSCVQIFEQGTSCLPIAQSLSLLLGKKVVFHEVTVKDEPGANGSAEDWAAVMVVGIWPDGSAQDVPPELHLDEPISGLDRYKASRKLLRALVDPKIVKHPGKPMELWLYREAPEEEEEVDEIEPRLRALIDDIAKAVEVSMTDIGGKPALRMELPDGTRRLSVVSAADLEVINQMTGLGL